MIRSFNGKTPRIHPTAFISETAYVVGDVEIGEYSAIWPGAVLRGDIGTIKIGRHTDIEDNSVLHGRMEIGDYVVVGHSVVLHGRRIGNHILVGSNATVLFEVEVGDYSIIGSNSVVEEGTKIPPRSFVVGVPAKIKSTVTEKQLEQLRVHDAAYSNLGQKFKQEGLTSAPGPTSP